MAAPHTDQSFRMMGRNEFAAMKSSSWYISVSRGATTDSQSLIQALQSGEIRGAGLDVTDPEPLPEDNPLRHMDNVVITPHIGGPSDYNRQRSFDLIKENIERFVKGEPLCNIINKRLGY